jgi:hypothetical protein
VLKEDVMFSGHVLVHHHPGVPQHLRARNRALQAARVAGPLSGTVQNTRGGGIAIITGHFQVEHRALQAARVAGPLSGTVQSTWGGGQP